MKYSIFVLLLTLSIISHPVHANANSTASSEKLLLIQSQLVNLMVQFYPNSSEYDGLNEIYQDLKNLSWESTGDLTPHAAQLMRAQYLKDSTKAASLARENLSPSQRNQLSTLQAELLKQSEDL